MSDAKELFLDALDLDAPEREAFLRERCGEDEELLSGALNLLEAHERSQAVFGSNAPGLWSAPTAGDRIGPYTLKDFLGEGGFATVWRATQSEPVRRQVALKIVKPGLESAQVIARFQAEQQALALMDHPCIARVFEGGITEGGHPWFSMELVDGLSITDHCEREGMPKSGRLDLFLDVCRAVQHAHQKGIIHRDLKPSNVLVAMVDGKPTPKVIDFGIAKAVDRSLGDWTNLTTEGQLIGTPAYMSPEQIDESKDVDTRADVYALGVLLYELLSGSRPFEDETLRAAGLAEILRMIREEEPPRPSTRGQATVHVLPREIRGDLDWIVMRCLEKERDRRYDSVSVLASELKRHLAGEPVLAGPPDFAYRARKFASRHRHGLALASTAVVLVVAGLIVSTTQLVRAREAEARQEIEIEKLGALSDFFSTILTGGAPQVAQADDPTLLLKILETGVTRAEAELGESPEVRATVHHAIASALLDLGQMERAEEEYLKAIELRRETLGEDHVDYLSSLADYGILLVRGEQFDEASEVLGEASRGMLGALPESDERLLRTRGSMAVLQRYQGQLDASVSAHRELLELWLEHYGEEHDSTITAMNNLASALREKGLLQESLELHTRAVELQEIVHGELHPETAISLNNVADILMDLDRFEEALDFLERSLERKRAILPKGHPSLAIAFNNLAKCHQELSNNEQAMALFDEALDGMRSAEALETPVGIRLRFNRGYLLNDMGDLEGALEVYRRCLESAQKAFGEGSSFAVQLAGSLGWQLVKTGRAAEGYPHLLARHGTAFKEGAANIEGAVGLVRIGVALRDLERNEEARSALTRGLAAIEEFAPDGELQTWIETATEALAGL